MNLKTLTRRISVPVLAAGVLAVSMGFRQTGN